MKLEDRLYLWEQYKNLATIFMRIVNEDLSYKFYPIEPSEVDEDTPNVKELFDMLGNVTYFISGHINEMRYEQNKKERENYGI